MDFDEFLRLERGLTENSVRAYHTDIEKLVSYLSLDGRALIGPEELTCKDLQGFVRWLADIQIKPRTQARILSGIKSFYKNLIIKEKIDEDPTEQFQTPKIERKLPTVLSVEEIRSIEDSFDTGRVDGVRNRAIIETLYSCGLRVSELTELRLSQMNFEVGCVVIEGKGRKERIVPIGERARDYIREYVDGLRQTQKIEPGNEDYVFINRSGTKLSRIMIFNIIKEVASKVGITKVVSPHTLRHSFATHLVDGGANLRAVQEMLGHESIVTTEIYTHLDDSYLRSTMMEHHPYAKKEE